MSTKTPPPLLAPPSADSLPPADDALSRLEARARAPLEAAADAGEALRASMAGYAARAAACTQRLAARQSEVQAQLQRVRALPLRDWGLKLGGGSTLIGQLRRVVANLAILYEPREDVPSVVQVLSKIPRRIANLTAADQHACPSFPPGCGCFLAQIRTDVEEAEVSAAQLPTHLATVADFLPRIDRALTARGDGVEVVAAQIAPRPDPRPADQAMTDFDPCGRGADHE